MSTPLNAVPPRAEAPDAAPPHAAPPHGTSRAPRGRLATPNFASMLGALVGGGCLGGLLGFLVGPGLAHRFGLADASGMAGYFVLFAAVPGCALFGAALALILLFRVVRGGAPPAALLALAALGGGLVTLAVAPGAAAAAPIAAAATPAPSAPAPSAPSPKAPSPKAPAHTTAPTRQPAGGTAMQLTSPAFTEGAAIPAQYTSDGPNVAPALAWSHAPAGTKSFVLIVDDPDAPDPANPKMTWVHWVLYDIPPDAHALPEGATDKTLPKGSRQGSNDWKAPGYRGPSPPVGRHRYYFKLYALDTLLGDLKQPPKFRVEQAMKEHVLAEAQLMGTYEKKR